MTGTKSPRENTPVGRGHLFRLRPRRLAILNYGGGRGFALALARGERSAIRGLVFEIWSLLPRVADFDLSLDGSNPIATTGRFNDTEAVLCPVRFSLLHIRKMARIWIFEVWPFLNLFPIKNISWNVDLLLYISNFTRQILDICIWSVFTCVRSVNIFFYEIRNVFLLRSVSVFELLPQPCSKGLRSDRFGFPRVSHGH